MSLAISSVEAIKDLVINSTVTTKIVRDPHTNKEYYLKIFKDRSMLDADQFIYSYLRLKDISHDNITKVLDMVINITTFGEPLRVLMDHYSEPNLENQINIRKRTKEKWTESQLLDYARQLISACAFMQEKNISDLSLSPSKIFTTENGKIIKIREFGYDIYNDIQRDNYRSSQNNYLFSPEQIKSFSSDDVTQIKQLDHFKCEVYILGLILLEMALLIELPSISQLHKFLPELKKLYPKLGNLICLMLSNNIEERPDLSALLDKLKLQAQKCGRCCRNVIEEDLKSLLNSKVCSDCFELLKSMVVRCHRCKELRNIREVYQSDEICCFVCIRKLVFHHDRIQCVSCENHVDAIMECGDMNRICDYNNKRCFICKFYLHEGFSCEKFIMEFEPERITNFECECNRICQINTDSKYYECSECLKCFCIVCFRDESIDHKLCLAVLRFGIPD